MCETVLNPRPRNCCDGGEEEEDAPRQGGAVALTRPNKQSLLTYPSEGNTEFLVQFVFLSGRDCLHFSSYKRCGGGVLLL